MPRMKKRILLLLFSVLLFMQSFASVAPADENLPEADSGATHLTVANPTPMLGAFFTDLWTKGTSDIDIRKLIHGYDLVFWDEIDGVFRADPTVVSGIAVTENAAGDRSYTFVLQRDLCYSDGSPINAWDYAFSILFQISRQIDELGGVHSDKSCLVGFEQYTAGTAAWLSGVRVPDDYTIVFSVRADSLPFFYEFGRLSCEPMPIALVAPGVIVRDDGKGIYLANKDPAVFLPVYNTALLSETLLNSGFNYLTVSAGPYTITDWDGITAEFERNPYYKGNAYGELPLIDRLTVTLAENSSMITELESGTFDIINKATDAEAITQGIALVGEGKARMASYPRTGLSFLSFLCERRTVSSRAVRQAIAWCMDRDAVTEDYTGKFGLRVDGFYGIGQWMYRAVSGSLALPAEPPESEKDPALHMAYKRMQEEWASFSLDDLAAYTVDTDRAKALLDADGWVLNQNGVREKWVDGYITKLDLTLVYPEGNRIPEILEEHFVPYLEECGIHLTMIPLPTREIFLRYYGRESREVDGRSIDMFYLGSNFDLLFDPTTYFEYNGNPYGPPQWLYTGYADSSLYNLACAMISTEPGKVVEYMREWIAFQKKFNEELPLLPVYSNVYFDFYRPDLEGYNIAERVTWSEAILGAFLAEPKPEEETSAYPVFSQP